MTDEVIPFQYASKPVRTVNHSDDGVWFALLDLAEILGITNPTRAASRLPADEVTTMRVNSPGGQQNMRMVSEPGMYRLVVTSRVAGAEQFKNWVFKEVLPSIRATGRYATREAQEDTALATQLLLSCVESIERRHPDTTGRECDTIRHCLLEEFLLPQCGTAFDELQRQQQRDKLLP